MENKKPLAPVVRYIISFLLGEGNEQWVDHVSYGETGQGDVNIVPSGFFDEGVYLQMQSLPGLPLRELSGIPLLFGEEKTEILEGKVSTHADIIASTFYLITRYEEYLRPDIRDCHGRFPGKQSLPYRAGFLHRPIVEEYGVLLRQWLREAGVPVTEPEKGIRKVFLTHDMDYPWMYSSRFRRFLSIGKDLLLRRDLSTALEKTVHFWEKDPFYEAFDWLKDHDGAALEDLGQEKCEILYFLLCANGLTPGDCGYSNDIRKTRKLVRQLQGNARIGLHTSYYAGLHPEELSQDIQRFHAITGQYPRENRYHFLSCREPGDLEALRSGGIRDDYTFAYADVAGFRLGTCRPVKWIDAISLTVTDLTLHPMTIMECTLDGESYMNLGEDEAMVYSRALIDQVYEHSGEVVLLWHNTSVASTAQNYQRRLYCKVLDYLYQKMHE